MTACDWCGEETRAPIPIQMRPHRGLDGYEAMSAPQEKHFGQACPSCYRSGRYTQTPEFWLCEAEARRARAAREIERTLGSAA